MPCNPNFQAVTLDIESGDFVRFTVSGVGGGGRPKFAIAANAPNGKIVVALDDTMGPPYKAEWPPNGASLAPGAYRFGFRGLYETCVRYQLTAKLHIASATTGVVLKDCSWDMVAGDPAPRSNLTITVS